MGRAVLDGWSAAGNDVIDSAEGGGLSGRDWCCRCGDLLLNLAVGELVGETSHDGGASAQGSESE